MAHRTIYLGPFEANCSSLQVVYSAYKTAMGRRQHTTTGKAARTAKLKSAAHPCAHRAALRESSELHDAAGFGDADEPQFAQPARKKARAEEPSRKSRRGEKRRPPLRGPPSLKPQRTPIGDLQPEDAEQRRKKQRGYDKTAYEKKMRAASPEVEQTAKLDEVPYSRTSTGKPRKGGTHAREAAKSRAKQKVAAALESCGDKAQQTQVLRDVSESMRDVAAGAGYHPS